MTTIVCVWVQGNVPYKSEYVFRLRSMVLAQLSWKHEFVVLTDQPLAVNLPGIRPIRIPSPNGIPGWWSKLELFNPQHGLKGPGLYLDLDVLIPSSIDPLFEYLDEFTLVPHAGNFGGRGKLKVVKRYNSSVMYFDDMAAYSELYTNWSPKVAGRLWGDQDWIGEQLPWQQTMPLKWFPRVSQLDLSLGPNNIDPDAKVILCKKPKNHELVKTWRWVDRMWNGVQ